MIVVIAQGQLTTSIFPSTQDSLCLLAAVRREQWPTALQSISRQLVPRKLQPIPPSFNYPSRAPTAFAVYLFRKREAETILIENSVYAFLIEDKIYSNPPLSRFSHSSSYGNQFRTSFLLPLWLLLLLRWSSFCIPNYRINFQFIFSLLSIPIRSFQPWSWCEV